jgi:hypothetical protein
MTEVDRFFGLIGADEQSWSFELKLNFRNECLVVAPGTHASTNTSKVRSIKCSARGGQFGEALFTLTNFMKADSLWIFMMNFSRKLSQTSFEKACAKTSSGGLFSKSARRSFWEEGTRSNLQNS